VVASGWATGGKYGKEGKDGAVGMLMLFVLLLVVVPFATPALVLVALALVIGEVSMFEVVFSVFTIL